MLNYIWSFLIIIGIIYASFTGQLEGLNENIISSAKDAVDLLILMTGVIGMWSGFLNIAEESGLTKYLSGKMKPLLRFLFPNIPKDHVANDYICANFIANILGLGWACTPTGIQAMKALKKLQEERLINNIYASSSHINDISHKRQTVQQLTQRNKIPTDIVCDTASDEMCTFLILNISSLQIVPMNMIAYRASYGSPAPMAVIAPGLISTAITTILAVVICRLLTGKDDNM